MRPPYRTLVTACTLLALSACSPFSGSPGSDSVASSSSSSEAGSVTRNVSFTGTLEVLGASIYQQGTHRLTLADGTMVLLESTDQSLRLDSYVGRKVEVRGSAEPTVEVGGTLLRVEEVIVLDAPSSSSSSTGKKMCGGIASLPCDTGEMCIDDLTDDCNAKARGADCSGVCVPSGSVSSASSRASLSSSTAVHAPVVDSVVSSKPPSTASDAQVELMAKQNYSSPLWTQEYCTGHVGFCIPVHKNWYFKSFGATTSTLWHVEFGMESPEELGAGVVILNVVSGSSASAGATSGQLKATGGDLVGYRDWEGNHFELSGDAALREALTYMLGNITPYKAE